MSPQRLRSNTAKYRLNADGSYYIFRFWPVAAMLLFITYYLVAGLQQRADVPRYHQECTAVWSSQSPPSPSQPCVYRAAMTNLTTYHDHSIRHPHSSQTADLTYPDATTASMEIQRIDGRENTALDITPMEVNGSCWAESWHGKVTAVLNTNHRLVSQENPEDKMGTAMWPLLLVLLVLTAIIGNCIRVSGNRELPPKTSGSSN